MALVLILGVAAMLRLYGLLWDQGQLFHPDERWLLIVADELAIPRTLAEWLPSGSPLNPFWDQQAQVGRRFAYGHAPLYGVRLLGAAVAPWAGYVDLDPTDPYMYLAILGRLLAVGADLATVGLTFVLGRRLSGPGVGLVAAAGVALAVLHIQLAHFFTTDPLVTPLILLALLAMSRLAETGRRWYSLVAGLCVGLAVGVKFNAVLLLLPLLVAHALPGFGDQHQRGWQLVIGPERWQAVRCIWKGLRHQPAWGLFWRSLGMAFLVFGVTNPYALLDPYYFAMSIGHESGMVQGRWVFPYTFQYHLTTPYLYPIDQQIRWFLGPALGLLAWVGAGWMVWRFVSGRFQAKHLPVVLWAALYFGVVGGAFVKFPRYLLPLTPLFFLFGAELFLETTKARPLLRGGLMLALFGAALMSALAFIQIYREPHPWIQASVWLYREAPPGALLVLEQWDYPLPAVVEVDGVQRQPAEFPTVTIDPFEESAENRVAVAQALTQAEVVVLASPRNWYPLSRHGMLAYPSMNRFYKHLLAGDAGFEIAAVWRVTPHLGPLAFVSNPFVAAGLPTPSAWRESAPTPWALDLGPADESFSVYDHPLTILLRNRDYLTAEMLQARLWPEGE